MNGEQIQSEVPQIRIQSMNEAPVQPRSLVVYWMIAHRRTRWNFALQRAADWSRTLGLPLLIFEALRVDYRWASDRLHQFIIEGMQDNQRRCADKQVAYLPYVEPTHDAGRGLLKSLGQHAAVVVTDDFPCFFLPRIVQAAARQLDCRLESVDTNGVLPMRAADRIFPLAHAFRRFLQKQLPNHLSHFPKAEPLHDLPVADLSSTLSTIARRWPAADLGALCKHGIHKLPIDHDVHPAPDRGGAAAAGKRLEHFLNRSLTQYAEFRNHPENDVASGLSPYLHFGHISAHQVVHQVLDQDGWSRDRLATKPNGSREGWWGASPPVESFLDELITWRELGYNMTWQCDDYDSYESLPDWVLSTLRKHATDPRQPCYDLEAFEAAETHDVLWNAAQRQLIYEGRIHNYLRMLWGKKILHWSSSPQEALSIMIELNNKYALDGRNPNSYSGIFWVLGRYDRAWGPERPIFGKVRYMASENTRKKLRLGNYLRRFGAEPAAGN